MGAGQQFGSVALGIKHTWEGEFRVSIEDWFAGWVETVDGVLVSEGRGYNGRRWEDRERNGGQSSKLIDV